MLISLKDTQIAEIVRVLADSVADKEDDIEMYKHMVDDEAHFRREAEIALDNEQDYTEEQTARFNRYAEWAEAEAADQDQIIDEMGQTLKHLQLDLSDALTECEMLEYAISEGYADELIPPHAYQKERQDYDGYSLADLTSM